MTIENDKKLEIKDFYVYHEVFNENILFGVFHKSIECETYYEYEGKYYKYYYSFTMVNSLDKNIIKRLKLTNEYIDIFKKVAIKDLIENNKDIKPLKKEDIPEGIELYYIVPDMHVIFHDLDNWVIGYKDYLTNMDESEKYDFTDNSKFDFFNKNCCQDYEYVVSRILFTHIAESLAIALLELKYIYYKIKPK